MREGMTMDDIDALKKEVAELRTELEETKTLSKQYLQNVAHQLTAPLGAIKWSIEALKDERVPLSRKKTLLSSVYSQATILVHLIKNFTLMSSLEADHELGQFREKPEPEDPIRLAINLVNDFQPQAFDQGIEISVDNDSFRKVFGAHRLLIEKNLVAQAISNILENAVKYAHRDSRILVSAYSSSGDVGICIESVGIPIPEADKELVFSRGFRGSAARQKVAAGTGFGLYLASRVMTFHEGRIDLQTRGKTSRFCLLFPRTRLSREK
jgi:signal transduction histidine kinase